MTLLGLDAGTKILYVGSFTVTTAGTPVALTGGRCKQVIIQADEDNGATILMVGDSTVDALSDPPISSMTLYATQRDSIRAMNASEVYIDATVDGGKGSYTLLG